jgi:predicted DNA binding CopG/RHH family protein
MKKKTKNEFPKNFQIVKDFLPPPEELLPKEELEKILIALDRPVIDFFKKRAQLSDQKYQRLIREVLHRYYLMHSKKASGE